MRLFDDDRIGCYLDHIDHRVEKTKGGEEVKMLDLTLRVQPFTADLAVSFDPDVRALLFTMSDGEPKPKIKSLEFALTIPRQLMKVHLLPESDVASQAFLDVEITQPRARTEKGVDGFALVLYASFGPCGADELEYVCEWLTQQRFVTFSAMQPGFDFATDAAAETHA